MKGEEIAAGLDARGFHILKGLVSEATCRALSGLYDGDTAYRSEVVMQRHSFGQGTYKYFAYPLPDGVQRLRSALYPVLSPIANRWAERLGREVRYPQEHAAYLEACHAAGQTRPTPLLLRYRTGDYNRLHQDLYGAMHFPLQAAVLLSEPGRDFTGGEFMLTEQTPRRQSRASVVPLSQGDAVIFPVDERPVAGANGDYRARMRHGVSEVLSGERHTLGIIFHDAT